MSWMKVITILGTRPEIIKLSPLINLLQDETIPNLIVHTGQHYDYTMDKVFFQELQLPEPAFQLDVGSLPREQQLALMQERIEPILRSEKPDLVIVQGDTNSTLAGARAAKSCGLLVMHIEAGCRSFNEQMPEEQNRKETDRLADFLMVPDADARKHLEDEEQKYGIKYKKMKDCGSTAYDATHRNLPLAQKLLPGLLAELNVQHDQFILVTIHRAENTEEPNFSHIFHALNKIAETEVIVFPLHPRTKKVLAEKNFPLAKNIRTTEPLPYFRFLALISSCRFCITDSGGVQEEAVAVGKSCLIPRNETEWMRPVNDGINILAGTTTEKILYAYHYGLTEQEISRRKEMNKHQYYRGASLIILREIKRILGLMMIHPTAEVSDRCAIGNGSKIWHQAQVREEAAIGNSCIIGKNAYIDKKVVIGNNCKVQNNCSLYHGVTLEDGVFIGPHCILTNDKFPRAVTPDGKLKGDTDWAEGKILVKEGASLGAGVIILPGVTVGRWTMVGAGSVVTKDVPDFGLVVGNPARLVGFVCKCGRKLEEGKKEGDCCSYCSTLR